MTSTGPLEGIRIVDLSRMAPGPFGTMLLADLGADVVMVEPPGDAPGPDDQAAQRRRAFNPLSRNKRSVVVNLKEDAGRAVVHDLARNADVFLEGFRPGVTDRLGVGYDAISKTNPGIVYASLSGYGQTGPYSDLVGHDINYLAIGGVLSMVGKQGQGLTIPPNTLGDFAAGGLMTAFAILAALRARDRIGRGQYIDLSMSDNLLYLLASQTGSVLGGARPPQPGVDMLLGGMPQYNAYECADGKYLSIGSLEPKFFSALCRIVGREDMLEGKPDAARMKEFGDHLAKFFKQKTRDEWFAELKGIEFCVAPVLEVDEALANEHNRARGMVVEVDDPRVGRVQQVGIGPKFSVTPGGVASTSPSSGAHTDEVLRGIGYDDAKIASLRASSAIA